MADTPQTPVSKWLQTIAQYDNEFKRWEARTTKIIKRYRDDNRSQSGSHSAKFNILWSNVQTLIPAVYAKLPKCDVSRRFSDNDQVGRVASLLIERAVDFEIEHYPDFRAAMRHAVEDRFLGGRGVAWVRYEPHVRAQETGEPEDGLQVTEDIDEVDEGGEKAAAEDGMQDPTASPDEVAEEIEYECAPTDYVHWKDFGHTVARTWEEVTAVWRWVYMDEPALIDRFGEETAARIPMDESPEPLTGSTKNRDNTQAKIAEIWDKTTGKVFWISKGLPDLIDEREDPLELEGFFPCGSPLYATTTSDSLVPVPDFALYQDQAAELDTLSDRIDGLVHALRVRGVYDASQPALQRLLTEGDNNTLIPVETWMAFSEKGGLKGSIDLLPLDVLAGALTQCYRAREDIKAQIYEITGISDIVRGQTSASETATAQQIKGQYAGLRLRSMQEEVALFATALLRLKAQVICEKFQPETILAYAAAQQLSPEDQAMIPAAMKLLKNQPLRNFRIEVAADSLVQIDEQQNKQDRLEFISAFGGFLKEAIPAAQAAPELGPVLVELLKFGTGAFKQSRQIEGSLDAVLEKMNQAQKAREAAPPQPPKTDPELIKLQSTQQIEGARLQAEQAKTQAQSAIEANKARSEAMKIQSENAIKAKELALRESELRLKEGEAILGAQIEREKLAASERIEQQRQKSSMMEKEQELDRIRAKDELDAATKILVARIGANPGMDLPMIEAQQAASELVANELSDNVRQTMQHMADMQGQTLEKLSGVMRVLASPKRIIRGPDGRAAGVEVDV